MSWDPSQYAKFAAPRLRPAIDLLNRIDLVSPGEVYDLGSGTGNVTRMLRLRWPDARITGVDSSQEMLAKAASEAADIVWTHTDLARWRPPRPADLIYSNAALHWIDDHEHFFPQLMQALAPGGVLAAQMPRNFSAPSHTAVAAAARGGPWRSKLEPLLRPTPVAPPDFYFELLSPCCASLDIWETEYLHVLTGKDPVKEWIKGSWLNPLLDALAEPERSEFEAAYGALVAQAYPANAHGVTLLPFRRLFFVAVAAR
jgi:trans-aconitate 2-methyltransferase